MNNSDFRKHAHEMVDWMANYLENIEQYPVKSQVAPNDIYNQIPENAPKQKEDFEEIMNDFNTLIMPGITHWQHPNFHAYFPGNSSYPSLLGEMLTSTIGAQCMIWDTSPAAAELEERVMEWLQSMLVLPNNFTGVIQDTASTATLTALLCAREKYSEDNINQHGFGGYTNLKIYCSTETHSSIEKGVKIAGFGKSNLTKIGIDDQLAMNTDELEMAITQDIANGNKPICVIAALGTTGTTAVDPLSSIASICEKYDIWLHVDAAYAGTALVLPEFRWMINGIEKADSFVFNPHKWMFTNFDCSVYFVKDKKRLIDTFEILPEYLKTKVDHEVNNYRDWGIPLGRRFRALKLWIVIRTYGVDGIKKRIGEHISYAKDLAKIISIHPKYEIAVPTQFNMVCFRYIPDNSLDLNSINAINEQLVANLNDSGQIYLTHTKVKSMYVIRLVIGQTYVEKRHVDHAWNTIIETAEQL